MNDSIPDQVWEIVKEFSKLVRDREEERQEACHRYLTSEISRYLAIKQKLPTYNGSKCPNGDEYEEGERDKSIADYDNYTEEAGKHTAEAGKEFRRLLNDPDESEKEKADREIADREIARLTCATICVAQSTPEGTPLLFPRGKPKFDGLDKVMLDLLVDPGDWFGEIRLLELGLAYVKEWWAKPPQKNKNGKKHSWASPATDILNDELHEIKKDRRVADKEITIPKLAKMVGVSHTTILRYIKKYPEATFSTLHRAYKSEIKNHKNQLSPIGHYERGLRH